MALPETSPAYGKRAARGYREYAPCLPSRAEAAMPTGARPRILGDCSSCGSKPAPRSRPLYYAATPLPPESRADAASAGSLGETEKSAPVLLQKKDARRRLSILEGIRIPPPTTPPTHPHPQLSGDPGPAGVEASARWADAPAFCIERNAEAPEISAKFKFEPTIRYAGFRWDCAAAAQQVGRIVPTVRYVIISRAEFLGLTRLDDGRRVA